MARNLQDELDKLKERILLLGSMVEENVRNAIRAFLDNDLALAQQVKARDDDIDRTEIAVEEECLRILALHQPVAGDLRFVVTVLKINNDLERIGDLASKIAKKLLFLRREHKLRGTVTVPTELSAMHETAMRQLQDSLDAFVNDDADLAYRVLVLDDEVDEAKHVIRRRLEEIQQQDPGQHVYLSSVLSITRSLERIGDHATNIAEDVIYMLQGRIIRHDPKEIA